MKIENSRPGIDGISTLTTGLSYLGNELHVSRARAQQAFAPSGADRDSCNFHNLSLHDK